MTKYFRDNFFNNWTQPFTHSLQLVKVKVSVFFSFFVEGSSGFQGKHQSANVCKFLPRKSIYSAEGGTEWFRGTVWWYGWRKRGRNVPRNIPSRLPPPVLPHGSAEPFRPAFRAGNAFPRKKLTYVCAFGVSPGSLNFPKKKKQKLVL